MNMLEATFEPQDGGLHAEARRADARGRRRDALDAHPALEGLEGRPVVLGIRPEALEEAVLGTRRAGRRRLQGRVELREALGSELMVHFAHPERSRPSPRTEESTPRNRRRPRGRALEERPQRRSSAGSARAPGCGGTNGRGGGRHARAPFLRPETGRHLRERGTRKEHAEPLTQGRRPGGCRCRGRAAGRTGWARSTNGTGARRYRAASPSTGCGPARRRRIRP